MPDETVKILGATILALIGLSSGLVMLLKRRHVRPVGIDTDRLNDKIDERVLHKLGNFVMCYRPVIEALARGDERAVYTALDRVDDEVTNQARLTAERLRR